MKREFRNWLEDEKRVSTRSYLNNGNLIIPHPDVEKELELVIKKYDELHKPVMLPRYVADWIKAERGTMSNWKLPSRFISDSKYKKDQQRYKWSQVEGNMDKFMSALINGFEVEEKPLYYALIKGHELVYDDDIYWNYDKSYHDVFVSRLHPPHANFTTEMTKLEWIKVGINDSNADFVEVDDQS